MAEVISTLQNLTHLEWAKARQSSSTAGSFLKSYDDTGPRKTYYKLSDYRVDQGIIGHECLNEIVADRLLTILGIEHLDYQLVHACVTLDGRVLETWLNVSDDFKAPGESKIALDTYYELEREPTESPLDFCLRMGWGDYMWRMLIVDYLILNRDRHGANIEVLRNPKSRSTRLAPLFDHGLSLMWLCRTRKQILSFDVMADLRVQSFVGSNSASDNLSLIPKEDFPQLGRLDESDRDVLFDGLEDASTPEWREAVWSMIWRRWKSLEAFRTA